LDAKVQTELETFLFRYRNCHYQGLIDDHGVNIFPQDISSSSSNSISSMLKNDCDPNKHDLYSLLANNTFLYNVLRTQFGCHDEWIDIDDLLGIIQEDAGTSTSTSTNANATNTSSTSTSTTKKKDDIVNDEEIGTLAALGEEQFLSSKNNTNSNNNNLGAKVAAPLLLIFFFVTMTGIYLLLHKRRQHQASILQVVVDLSAFLDSNDESFCYDDEPPPPPLEGREFA
jgi:hypothetical protein